MRTALRILWYGVGSIALVVTIIVGLLTIIEKSQDLGITTYRRIEVLRLWRTARRVLAFMKTTHPTKPYTIDGIAAALKTNFRKTSEALSKLQSQNSVRSISVDETIDGKLWLLDEMER
jgi:hypothetical protein